MRRWVVVVSASSIVLAISTSWSRTDDEVGASSADEQASSAPAPADAGVGEPELAPIDAAEDDASQVAPGTATVRAEIVPARDPRLELGLFTGGQLVYPMLAPLSKSGLSFGVRGGYRLVRWLVIESELGFAPTEAEGEAVLMVAWRVHGLLQLPPDGLRAGTLRPFFVAGAGGITSSHASSRRAGQELQIPLADGDTDFAIDAGIGLKYTGLGALGLRLDVRAVATPLGKDAFDTPDFELLFGAYGRFGGTRAPHERPVIRDGDGDGVLAASDRCPSEAEDLDEFEDTDGCPDPDNDGDRIADADDGCPLEAEDVNEIDDGDGCPDLDEDGDTVLGSADACPAQPEDIDAVEDQDGCPDPDNDGDGVLDAADTCPTGLEVVNGFEDADGCPDQMPPEVLAIIGELKGVTFDRTGALVRRGRPPRSKPLDALAATLAAFPSIEIEITVFAATSQRADAVKQYLVERGVDDARMKTSTGAPVLPIKRKRRTRSIERIEVSVVGHTPPTGNSSTTI